MLLADNIDMETETIQELISEMTEEEFEITEYTVWERAYEAYMCSVDY